MSCEYVRENYAVPAKVGMLVKYKDRIGIIAADRGNYVGVNFDDDKPGHISNVHPTDPNLVYSEKIGKIRKLTRSQQRYQQYLYEEYPGTFAEWLGCDPKSMANKKRYIYWGGKNVNL